MLKQIKNFEDYAITENGEVYSFKRNRFLKLKKHKTGYLYVNLCKDGKVYFRLIHRLVALAFIEKTEEDIKLERDCIDHRDGCRTNNHVSNLRWVTRKENNNFELARENQSKAHLGNKLSEEHKEKLRRAKLGNKNALGFKHSKETKAKMSKVHSKPIIIDNIEYKSTKEASKELNIPRTTIVSRLNSKNFKNYQYLPQK